MMRDVERARSQNIEKEKIEQKSYGRGGNFVVLCTKNSQHLYKSSEKEWLSGTNFHLIRRRYMPVQLPCNRELCGSEAI